MLMPSLISGPVCNSVTVLWLAALGSAPPSLSTSELLVLMLTLLLTGGRPPG